MLEYFFCFLEIHRCLILVLKIKNAKGSCAWNWWIILHAGFGKPVSAQKLSNSESDNWAPYFIVMLPQSIDWLLSFYSFWSSSIRMGQKIHIFKRLSFCYKKKFDNFYSYRLKYLEERPLNKVRKKLHYVWASGTLWTFP